MPSPPNFSTFQTHLSFFSTGPPSYNLTLLSSLRATLKLGANFPVALFTAILVRVFYGSLTNPFRAPRVEEVGRGKWRTQLEGVKIDDKRSYSASEVVNLYDQTQTSKTSNPLTRTIDRAHILSFWALSSNLSTHTLSPADIRAFQRGDWAEGVVERRKSRKDGKGEVLPFWRGGPLSVGGHSWAVRKVFGVRVYEDR